MGEKASTEQELLRRAEAAEERAASFEKQVLALALARDEDRMRGAEVSELTAKVRQADTDKRRLESECVGLRSDLTAHRFAIQILQETIAKMAGAATATDDNDDY